jgi:hypothetical protein
MRWRWITWVILLFSGAMLLWASTRIGSEIDCAQHIPGSAAQEACELQRDVRSGIGLFAVGVVWIGGSLVLVPRRAAGRRRPDLRRLGPVPA